MFHINNNWYLRLCKSLLYKEILVLIEHEKIFLEIQTYLYNEESVI
jgi:hypothetical protein